MAFNKEWEKIIKLFVNCSNHSLNSVGVTAAKQYPIRVTCFGIIKNISFFSRSRLRWELLKNVLTKQLSYVNLKYDGAPEYKRLALTPMG